MADKLNLDTIMNEPRKIEITLGGRRLKYLPFLSAQKKQITVNIPNPSIRKAGELRAKYWAFAKAWANKEQMVMARIMLDVVSEVFKPYRPFFTKGWVARNLDNDSFIQIYDFIMQPTKEKEEEYLKNALTLQKVVENQN
jgi:hypothetical protein